MRSSPPSRLSLPSGDNRGRVTGTVVLYSGPACILIKKQHASLFVNWCIIEASTRASLSPYSVMLKLNKFCVCS